METFASCLGIFLGSCIGSLTGVLLVVYMKEGWEGVKSFLSFIGEILK